MNAPTKAIQDDDLRFSPGLFLSGLKSHKLDSIQVDCQKRIIDRSRQFSHKSRFIPEQFIEGAQEPHIVDAEMNASPLRHVSYRLWTWVPATEDTLRSIHAIYTSPWTLVQPFPSLRRPLGLTSPFQGKTENQRSLHI